MDGSDEHRLTSATIGWGLSLSPDRRWLATAANGFVEVFDAKDVSSPPTLLPIPDGWVWDVAWSPDGSHLAMMASMTVGGDRIGVMAADGSDFHVVPTGPGRVDLIGWQP